MTCQPTAGCTQSDRTSHWPCSIGHAPDALPVARDADKLAPSVLVAGTIPLRILVLHGRW